MAEMKGTTLGILIRIGSGEPVEVAEVEVPLRMRLARTETRWSDGRVEAYAHVEADWDELSENVKSAIHRAADEIPSFGPIDNTEEHR